LREGKKTADTLQEELDGLVVKAPEANPSPKGDPKTKGVGESCSRWYGAAIKCYIM
jgi:hypothetical protein